MERGYDNLAIMLDERIEIAEAEKTKYRTIIENTEYGSAEQRSAYHQLFHEMGVAHAYGMCKTLAIGRV